MFGFVVSAFFAAGVTGVILLLLVQLAFIACAGWRVLMGAASLSIPAGAARLARDEALPTYTVLVALLDEAELLPQIVERLAAIDYPADKLDGVLLLEKHDDATISAAVDCKRPEWLRVLVAPDVGPRTKPRALNLGLATARGEYVTVYDAEDDPDPLQLREAAERFARDTNQRLWGLQAPLRIRVEDNSASRFLDRQFAIEYASLFEVTLPSMARLGLPFPLGGTSNHFRASGLRAVGGWDAHNVTEDADLGFRLWRAGGGLGMLTRPTYEPPPGALSDWLPQRARWLKGFMQTWGVHTRDVRGLGWRGGVALTMTLGASVAAAAIHAGSLAWVAASVAIALAAANWPDLPVFSLSVLLAGTAAAWFTGLLGAAKAGFPHRASDMILAPAYWSLLSLGFFHALWRLITEPHVWDKTRHRPDRREEDAPSPAFQAGREVAARPMA